MQTEILIAGGGIAGLTLGALLGSAGLPCAVIDTEKLQPVQDAPPSGRTAALMDGSVNILKAAGVWESLSPHATPLKILRLVDDSSSTLEPVRVDFHAGDIGLDAFGYNIPNSAIRNILADHVAGMKNVKHFSPARLAHYSVEKQGISAELEDGTRVSARMIVGADGRKSRVREIAGIRATEKDHNQSAIICLIEHSKPHYFTSTEHHRPGGPFTLVPMPGNTSSVVWVERREDAQGLLKLKKAHFEKALQDRTRGAVGKVKLLTDPESFPLIAIKAERLSAERVVLAAEAAHVFSPIGAQGLNLSLRDVAALTETMIDAARLGEDIGGRIVLQRYEKRRQPDISTRVFGVNTLNRIVSNDAGFLRMIRRASLKTIDASSFLKTLAMEQGLTPSLDDGRLIRGQAL